MAASFPGALASLIRVVDGALGGTDILAVHQNEKADEIEAVETELGTDPAGPAADLKTRLLRALIEAFSANVESLSANKTLTDADAAIQYLNPNGANRDVTLPALGPGNHQFIITNTAGATYNLVIKNPAAAILATITPGGIATCFSGGLSGVWRLVYLPAWTSGTTNFLREDGTLAAPTAPSSWATGDIKMRFDSVVESGWLRMDEGTIGDASSGASLRANADCENLFLHLWNKLLNTYAPVVGGRGASAAADWAAHKKITLPHVPGRSPLAAGAGTGLTTRNPGESGGEETHALTSGENGPHVHSGEHRAYGYAAGNAGGGSGWEGHTTGNVYSSGDGTPHNTMHPWIGMYFYIKL
jgi:hypothetical protein